MKKFILIFITAFIGTQALFAQCSPVPNDFEMRLLTTSKSTVTIQIRYHAGVNPKAESSLPNQQFRIDGLVFAIAWPTTSNTIHFTETKSLLAPFDVALDAVLTNGTNKNALDNIQTFFHNNTTSLPTAYTANWKANEWMNIATLSYTGDLQTNDFFSFVTCDYGIAHPNSYYGNSTTDPWFAMLDNNGKYVQYSPKMITELPKNVSVNNVFKIYPNPATTDIHIDIQTNVASNAAIKIVDETGRIVKIIAVELQSGNNINNIYINELAAGNYYVHITDGKSIDYIQKIQKL
jgi:hypothetical protein